jgi:hypothetical protein
LYFLGKNGTILAKDYSYTSGLTGLKGPCVEKGKARTVIKKAEPTSRYTGYDYTTFKAALR